MGRDSQAVAIARGVVKRRWADVLSAIPLVGPLLGPAKAEADYWESRDIEEEAIVQVVQASRDLCEGSLVYRPPDVDDVLHQSSPAMPLRQFVKALVEGSEIPDWRHAKRPDVAASEISRRWSTIPGSLEQIRTDFVRELGGSFLLPKDAARAVNLQRRKMAQSVELALACADAAGRLLTLELNGGLAPQKARAEARLLKARLAVGFTLADVLAAYEQLVAAAWREIPKRMGELFPPPPDPVAIEAARTERRRDALRDIVENAREVPVDAAELGDLLEHTTVREYVGSGEPVTIAAFIDKRFAIADGHAMNGWNAISGHFEGARSRFENLTVLDALEVESAAAESRDQIIKSLNRGAGAASEISSRYWARRDAEQRHQPSRGDIAGETAAGRVKFDSAVGDILGAVKALEALLETQ